MKGEIANPIRGFWVIYSWTTKPFHDPGVRKNETNERVL